MRNTLHLTALLVFTTGTLMCQVPANTIPLWDGTTFISSFGVVNTATYGQTITMPAGGGTVTGFTVEIGNCGANVTLRGEVYAWDSGNSRATGAALYESSPVLVTNNSAFQAVTMNTGTLNLAGGNYVLFVSTSRDQTGAPSSACRFGSVPNTLYPGGQFVFINNTADTTQWTGGTWSTIAQDLAFQVNGTAVANQTAAVPAASTTSILFGVAGVIGLGLLALKRRRLLS